MWHSRWKRMSLWVSRMQQYRAGGLIELAGNAEAAQQLYNNRYDMNKYPPLP